MRFVGLDFWESALRFRGKKPRLRKVFGWLGRLKFWRECGYRTAWVGRTLFLPGGQKFAVWAVWGWSCSPLPLPRRSAQDDTEGYSVRGIYNSHSSCIERKSGTTHGSFPTKQTSRISRSKRPTPPSEARAGARGSASNPVWSLPSGGLLRARNFTAQGNRICST